MHVLRYSCYLFSFSIQNLQSMLYSNFLLLQLEIVISFAVSFKIQDQAEGAGRQLNSEQLLLDLTACYIYCTYT